MIDYRTYPKFEQVVMSSKGWTLKWGIYVVFLFLFFVLIAASLIPYNRSLEANIKISSLEPIVFMTSEGSGHLTNIELESGQFVEKYSLLGHISKDNTYKSVEQLSHALKEDSLSVNRLTVLSENFDVNLDLSVDLADSYARFLTAYGRYIHLKDSANIDLIESDLKGKFTGNLKSRITKRSELQMSIKADSSASSIIERHRGLFKKGIISKQLLEEKEQAFYESIKNTERIRSEIDVLNNSLNRNKNEHNTEMWKYKEVFQQSFLELSMAKRQLQAAISDWKSGNVLISPVSGSVFFYEVDHKMRKLNSGDTIFTIIPKNNDKLIGRVKIPPKYLTMVRPNQRVIVELENYPPSEWGNIEGNIKNVSKTLNYNQEAGFLSTVEISSHKTNYDKDILVTPDMTGNAIIVLEETSVLESLFYQLKYVFKSSER